MEKNQRHDADGHLDGDHVRRFLHRIFVYMGILRTSDASVGSHSYRIAGGSIRGRMVFLGKI